MADNDAIISLACHKLVVASLSLARLLMFMCKRQAQHVTSDSYFLRPKQASWLQKTNDNSL